VLLIFQPNCADPDHAMMLDIIQISIVMPIFRDAKPMERNVFLILVNAIHSMEMRNSVMH
jgi:hypothetical protein